MAIVDIPTGQPRYTAGQLADHFKVSLSQVRYVVDAYRIQPAGRVGILRFWTEAELPEIKSALARVRGRRPGL